jgi:hypothetical protein
MGRGWFSNGSILLLEKSQVLILVCPPETSCISRFAHGQAFVTRAENTSTSVSPQLARWRVIVHSNRVAHPCLRSDRLPRCLALQVRACLTTILFHYTMAINMCLQSRHAWSFMSDEDVAPKLEKLGLILELSLTCSDLQSLQV